MSMPLDQIVIGMFALATALVTGILAIYNTKVAKRVNKVEEKSANNELLTVENDILEKILPVLERKDEALDKIAEILQNIIRVQELQNTRLDSISELLRRRCQAPELVKAINDLKELEERKGVQEDLLRSLIEQHEDTENTE